MISNGRTRWQRRRVAAPPTLCPGLTLCIAAGGSRIALFDACPEARASEVLTLPVGQALDKARWRKPRVRPRWSA